ncbi:MAG: patatin-like phospholipase family protein [Desulfobacteraceae bacterium]|jgi:NTE family protein
MIGLALSGGGSRAIAFHLGCLRALHDVGLLQKVNVLSTISGGSVIGAYYAYYPDKSFEEFETDIRKILEMGFQKKILWELIKPQNAIPVIAKFSVTRIEEYWARLRNSQPVLQRYPSRTDIFQKVLEKEIFHGLKINSNRRNNMDVIIGSCELRTGTAFRFSNKKTGYSRGGELTKNDIHLAFAVTASAAYPLFLPAFDRTFSFIKKGNKENKRVILTDGGVYDNLGIQVLEPGRNPKYSIHTFPCKYIISCNAGHGLLSGKSIPMGFYSRISKTFGIIHKRVQDSAMNRLHHLKEAGIIKGFAMPYLGQQDKSLPWIPSTLIPREEVIDYPTDFATMKKEWIEKLSNRGEQLTRFLVTYYLKDII